MHRRRSHLTCLTLMLALAGADIVRGEIWQDVVQESADAVEDQLGRGMYSTSSDLELPYDGGVQVIGLRFSNVHVPKGASIDRAYIEFTVDEVEVDLPVNLVIDGELKVDPAKFGSAGYDVANRERTNTKVLWQPEHFPTVGEQHQTSDISAVIEEIVNITNWYAGSDLVLIISDDPTNPSLGHRTVETGRGDDSSPRLHIEWSLGNAGAPNPPDGKDGVSIDTDLSWNAGPFAAATNGQTFFFSDDFTVVNDGVGGVTQTATTYDLDRLDYGTTYFWRVRQNNDSSDNAVNEGRVWSFTTEFYSYPIDGATIAATASSSEADFGPENTVNGSGLDANDRHSTQPEDMWLSAEEPNGASIQYEFDRTYKLHEMWVWNSNQVVEGLFGIGAKDVTVEYSTDGVGWTVLPDVPQFAQADGADGYAYNTTVDFAGVPARYVRLTANTNWKGIVSQFSLSEVRFFYIPVTATNPSPPAGATDVAVDTVLNWFGGREADAHDVYLSTDEQAVIDGTALVATVTEPSYVPADLAFSAGYFWKIVEVNDVETPSTWESDVWSFTTSDHLVVDDFEGYSDFEPDRIFDTWIDGWEVPTNGSVVGYGQAPFAEQRVVHGGGQSMPMAYANTGGASFSECTRTFAAPQDWSTHGITTLVIWFHGAAGNTGQMYVKVNGTKIPYDGPSGNIGLEAWQLWNVDLASSGANLQSVNSLTVGVDGSGVSGMLYIDDIDLFGAAPEPVNEWRIVDDLDDVEESVATGSMDVGSSDLELAYEGTGQSDPQLIGLRFTDIAIPQGATITEAWVRFQVDETKGGTEPVNLIIEGELSPNASEFSSSPLSVSSRTATTAQVKWSVPDWTNVGDQGPDQTTPSLVSVIQEIVNQNDWAGGALVLMFRDDPDNPSLGVRCAEAGPGDDAALLYISYE